MANHEEIIYIFKTRIGRVQENMTKVVIAMGKIFTGFGVGFGHHWTPIWLRDRWPLATTT